MRKMSQNSNMRNLLMKTAMTALFNHKELERLRGQEPTDPHQRFLWRIIRMGVIDPEAADKAMDTSTRSMRHSSAIGMRLWKMWREAEG